MARCRCCSTAAASRRSRRSPASSTRRRRATRPSCGPCCRTSTSSSARSTGRRPTSCGRIDSLERLSRTLVDQRARIANVIDNLGPGLDVLNQQRGLLVGTLQSLNRLSDVGTDVIRRSQANTVADLRALQPILRNLVEAGDALPGSLQILLTIPFADNSLNVIKGDFANIDVSLQINLQGPAHHHPQQPRGPRRGRDLQVAPAAGHDASGRGRGRRGSRWLGCTGVDEHGGPGSPAARSRRR